MDDRARALSALAFIVEQVRPEWNAAGTFAVLSKIDRPLPAVACAALFCALKRTDQRTPAVIALDGEHWRALANLTGAPWAAPTNAPPSAGEIACRIHGDRQPCRGCRADAIASAYREATDELLAAMPDREPGESLVRWVARCRRAARDKPATPAERPDVAPHAPNSPEPVQTPTPTPDAV